MLSSLDWDGDLKFPRMVRKTEPEDGSCFFHSFVDAFYEPYQEGKINRAQFVRQLRKDLAIALNEKVGDQTRYQQLSNGELSEISKSVKELSLENMQLELDSSSYVSNSYIEYLSNLFDKNIYLLDEKNKDVYMTADEEIIYKDRDSVVILYIENMAHYELVGTLSEDGILKTKFKYDDPLIMTIKKRILDKKNIFF